MSCDLWERPLEVTIDHGDHFKTIRNCRDAIAYMMTSWPDEKKASFSLARRLCLKAVGGGATTIEAAAAFEAAAKDAGLVH